jgi:hypothetical protein
MKIGELKMKVAAPDPARLLSSTGYTPEAMAALLDTGTLMAGTVAAALLACASGDDLPERHDLARAIAAEGVAGVQEQVRRLYARKDRARGDEKEG